MKKLVALTLCLILSLCACAALSEAELSSATTEQLHKLVDLARNELTKRELVASGEELLIESGGVSVYLTGDYEVNMFGEIALDVIVINNTDSMISVMPEACSLNGWTVSGMGVYDVVAGKKSRGSICFDMEGAGITQLSEAKEVETVLVLLNSDSWDTIAKTEPITIHLNVD